MLTDTSYFLLTSLQVMSALFIFVLGVGAL